MIYRAEKDHCRRFPGAASRDLRGGPKRNFQVFSALDFLAEVTQHIPERGEHLVRYYGWYSHRQRGIRKRTRQVGHVQSDKLTIDRSALDTQTSATGGALSAWARLINRVYEVDPLECPCCGGQMKIASFIERPPGRCDRAGRPARRLRDSNPGPPNRDRRDRSPKAGSIPPIPWPRPNCRRPARSPSEFAW